MRWLILLLLISPAAAQTTIPPVWSDVGKMHVNIGPPRQYIPALFVNSYTGAGPAAGVWETKDLTSWGIGLNAKAAFVSGILIITSGNQAETADLGVVFRTPGDIRVDCTPANYIGQTVYETNIIAGVANAGGQRSTMSSIVPVVNGKVEWCWSRSTQGQWPTHPSYGINLSLQGWFE